MIEQQIENLIAALDRNTAALTAFLTPNLPPAKAAAPTATPEPTEPAKATKKTGKKDTPAAETAPVGEATVTLEVLRGVADKLLTGGKQAAVYAIVRKFGAENLRTLDASKYVECHAALVAELENPAPAAAPAAPVAPVKTETAPAPKPVEKKPEPEVTLAALKEFALRLVDQGCAPAIGALAQKYGKKRLSEIPETAYVEAFAALKEIEATIPAAA